ncbi:hypothetical protein EYF80_059409 [Liparis tanakae]|uniref:Uncharacterized protein n=1 Tax=Liparis tanakae TaxID=230148 RepID=A0A4Z2ENV7_9TELE|nr:hypothetical protein EYF80_059409 [Liparis tanakae]
MQVHSPNALTAHVKWFLPHEHSALPRIPAQQEEEEEEEEREPSGTLERQLHGREDLDVTASCRPQPGPDYVLECTDCIREVDVVTHWFGD